MVMLPKGFVGIGYPGYYWNVKEQKLYSCKIGGMLKPLRVNERTVNVMTRFGMKTITPGYNISHKGRPIHIPLERLINLKTKLCEWFPVQK